MSTKPRWHPGALLMFLALWLPGSARSSPPPPHPAEEALREARAGLVEQIQVARQRLIDLDDRAVVRGDRDAIRQRRINRLLGISPGQLGAVYESTVVCAATLELLRWDPLFREPDQVEALTAARDAALQLLLPLVPDCRYLVSTARESLLAGLPVGSPVRLESLPVALLGSSVPPSGIERPGPVPVTEGPAVEVGGGRIDWRGVEPIPGRDEAIAWTNDALYRLDLLNQAPPELLGPIARGTTPDVSSNGTEVAALIPQPAPGDSVRLGVRSLDGRPGWKTIHDLRPGPPAFAPHRPLLAWTAGAQVRIWDVEGDSMVRTVVVPDRYALEIQDARGRLSWSPDGRSIAVSTAAVRLRPEGPTSVASTLAFRDISGEAKPWPVDIDTVSRPERLAERDAPRIGPARRPKDDDLLRGTFRIWDVDSRRIFGLPRSRSRVAARSSESDDPLAIVEAPARWQYLAVIPSPDGRWLAAVRDHVDHRSIDRPFDDPADPLARRLEIEIVPIDRAPGLSFDPGPPVETSDVSAVWHPSSRWLLVSNPLAATPALAMLDIATGDWTALAPGPIRNVDFTSDGRRLVWRDIVEGGSRIMTRPFEPRPTAVNRGRKLADEGRTALDGWENGPALARFLDAARLSGLDPSFFQGAGAAAAHLGRSAVDPGQAEVAWNAAIRWLMSAMEVRPDHLYSRIDLNDAVGRYALLRGRRLGLECRAAAIATLEESAPPAGADGDKFERARSLCEQALLWNPWNDVSRTLLNGLLARPAPAVRR